MARVMYVFWASMLMFLILTPVFLGSEILVKVLLTGIIILSFYFFVVYGYNVIVSMFGYKNIKRDYTIKNDKTKFLIMIAAHNEEAVIRETIHNIKNIDYDNKLFDICVVSDNSTDNTTSIARSEDVIVVDTIQKKFKREGVGKPAGIQYALREIGFDTINKNYDMIMVLDADNFVSENILKEVNSQYITKGKPEAIQTYLDTKNYSNLMSLAYSVVFWTNNRFMQLAKYRLGLPNSIGGTGFFIKTDWLISKGGFKFDSLTEDLEMEIEIVKEDGRILWNDHASIYDEKPEGTIISMIQRHRWIKGHWYVAFKQILPLLKKFIMTLNIKYLDKIFFLMSMGKAFHMFIMFILLVINLVLLTNQGIIVSTLATLNTIGIVNIMNDYVFYISGFNIILICYSFILLPVYSAFRKIRNINPLNIIIALQWFMVTDFIVQLQGLFTWPNQHKWVRTPHVKTELEVQEEVSTKTFGFEHESTIEIKGNKSIAK